MNGLRLKQVQEKFGIRKTKIYHLIAEGLIPQPVKLGSASVWVERELDLAFENLASRPRRKSRGKKKSK